VATAIRPPTDRSTLAIGTETLVVRLQQNLSPADAVPRLGLDSVAFEAHTGKGEGKIVMATAEASVTCFSDDPDAFCVPNRHGVSFTKEVP
jgi:hypothetical protein